jgi:hypothetical protein
MTGRIKLQSRRNNWTLTRCAEHLPARYRDGIDIILSGSQLRESLLRAVPPVRTMTGDGDVSRAGGGYGGGVDFEGGGNLARLRRPGCRRGRG